MSGLTQAMRVVLRLGVGISFLILIGAVTVQVVGRSFVGSSPVWTEELTRFALLYLAGFGTGQVPACKGFCLKEETWPD